MNDLQSPFPYFGGKASISEFVWDALGQPKHYIEPFFGSGAVLLARPNPNPTDNIESICDKDGFVCNVWRALQADPDAVAKVCDWPVNHIDLNARRRKLLAEEANLVENLTADPEWYDTKLAGYWIWAASCWIGSGLTMLNARPHLGDAGMGVHKIGQRPHLSNSGMGVHRIGQIPHLGDAGRGVQEPYNTNLYTWFRALSERLRYVRVVCGDWTRVCGGEWQDKSGLCGMFFDPPYGITDRDTDLYHHDSSDVAHDVRAWCLERGKLESYRIVIAGYQEHEEELSAAGWRVQAWKAGGGYSKIAGQANENRHRERLYFSPHCLTLQADLFSVDLA